MQIDQNCPSLLGTHGVIFRFSDPLTALYSITYMYYSILGCFITVGVGWAVSCFTASESDQYDEELIHPWARKMADLFPGKKRQYYSKDLLAEPKEKVKRNSSNAVNVAENGVSRQSSVGPSKRDLEVENEKVEPKIGTVNAGYSPDMPMEEVNGTYKVMS